MTYINHAPLHRFHFSAISSCFVSPHIILKLYAVKHETILQGNTIFYGVTQEVLVSVFCCFFISIASATPRLKSIRYRIAAITSPNSKT